MYDHKSLIRLRLIKKREKLYSKKISFSFEKVFSIIKKNFSSKKPTIAGYYPSDFEVNILDFLYKASKKNFRIGLPVVEDNYKMIFKHWIPNEPLYVNKYGILEPKKQNKKLIPDVILVPLVAFDKNLYRIGYGKGYYDRALKQLSIHKKIVTIGVAFSFQECPFIPKNQHDYKLDCILTERKLIYNKNNENFISR